MKHHWLLVAASGAFLLSTSCETVAPASAPVPAPAVARSGGYLSDSEIDRLKGLLPGPFPARADARPDEAAAFNRALTDAEVQIIRGVQEDTSAQARARADHVEEEDPVWEFGFVLGEHFNAKECPAVAKFFNGAEPEVAAIKNAAKKKFQRPRPPHSGITTNDSYPSGHSTRAFFRARMLIEIAPEKKDEIMRAARSMVLNRMIAGKHHPSDCAAGILLGTSIAEAMLANEKARADVAAAKAEWERAGVKKKEHVPGA